MTTGAVKPRMLGGAGKLAGYNEDMALEEVFERIEGPVGRMD